MTKEDKCSSGNKRLLSSQGCRKKQKFVVSELNNHRDFKKKGNMMFVLL